VREKAAIVENYWQVVCFILTFLLESVIGKVVLVVFSLLS